MDRLGAQARQTARTEPAAARRDRHHLHPDERAAACGSAVTFATSSPSIPTRKLPRDTVRRLIGKMAHPLNRPRFDIAAARVVEGYARAAAAGDAFAAGRP